MGATISACAALFADERGRLVIWRHAIDFDEVHPEKVAEWRRARMPQRVRVEEPENRREVEELESGRGVREGI